MHETSRRSFLAGSAALPAAAALPGIPSLVPMTEIRAATDTVAADLARYIGFGGKQAGGPGDIACGNWLASELQRLGFAVERQDVSTPFFDAERCELTSGAAKAPVWPQPIVTPTGPDGVTGTVVRVDPAGRSDFPLENAIALIDLPFGRWSTALAKPIREPVLAAFAAGAKAAIIVTNGPTGKVIALNADGRKAMFPGPVAVLAPEDAQPFLAAAARREAATLHLVGTGGRRPAFNFVGRIDRGKDRWLAVSTPRSGWYGCAAERGPGIATWLWLARWASKAVQDHNLAFICNSGHEYENLGAAETLKATAPKPAETHFWLHLGANVAGRDWHDAAGSMQPLPSIDPQRFLSVSRSLLPLARSGFAGHVGLETPYPSDVLSAGELNEVIGAGYQTVAGVFGIHRFHHVAQDDARCVDAHNVAVTAAGFQLFLERVLRGDPSGSAA
ncbi:secreted protein [Novosphingobium sp. PhB165]|uniref:twin-arginine translocation signal domain-containing protein n=1 Tax=Novosphingobium sp. PhB165 TaxID=2485105 RepID=UPI001045B97B|nr:twin-arginine translocation signal domain-containing protein [Novosphingobium sp. PhB165]TCM15392.1 secreted protein [Novosphingobium sp. PhB165]